MTALLLKILGLFLLSTVKFAVATVPIAIAFPIEQALLISISGGIAGAFFFMYLWKKVLKIWQFFISKNRQELKTGIQINKKKRRLVKFKNSYGYWGIILTTPSILSIPLGALLLANYFKKRRFVFFHLSLSIILWGTALIFFFSFFRF